MLSVVMLAWNRLDMTTVAYDTLVRTLPKDIEREIIFVDNGSRQDSGTMLWAMGEMTHPRRGITTYVRNHENRGLSQGFNYGLRLARGEDIFITDNDYMFSPGWYEECKAIMDAVPDLAAISPSDNRHAERQVRRRCAAGVWMEEPFNIVTCALVRPLSFASYAGRLGLGHPTNELMPTYGALYGESDTLWCKGLRDRNWRIGSLVKPLAAHQDWDHKSPSRESNEAEQKKLGQGERDPRLMWKFTL